MNRHDEADPTRSVPRGVLERAARVRLVLLDADGVLTDGRLYLAPGGHDGRAFHTRDGLGIRIGQRSGLQFGIISGRECQVVADRGRELSVTEIHQGERDKLGRLGEILKRFDLPEDAVCFVGDDLPDVPVMRRVGLAVAPADAAPEVRTIAHWVTEHRGGEGAVREVIDLLLRATGNWERTMERYFGSEPS